MADRSTSRGGREDKGGGSAPRPSPGRRDAGGQGGSRSGSGAAAAGAKSPISPSYAASPRPARSGGQSDAPRDRGLRRAMFLAELAEARELRRRVAPRRARVAELHARLLRTFRY